MESAQRIRWLIIMPIVSGVSNSWKWLTGSCNVKKDIHFRLDVVPMRFISRRTARRGGRLSAT